MANFRIKAQIQCGGPGGSDRHDVWGEGELGLTTDHEFREVLSVVKAPDGWLLGVPTVDPAEREVHCPSCRASVESSERFLAYLATQDVPEDPGGDAHRGAGAGARP